MRSFFGASSCSHRRSTRHPRARRPAATNRSRSRLRRSFFLQYSQFVLGGLECCLHACQKHPSTKTARCAAGNTKSGFPNRGHRRRQPVMPFFLRTRINANSVSVLPSERIRDITSERFFLEKTSAIIRIATLPWASPSPKATSGMRVRHSPPIQAGAHGFPAMPASDSDQR